MYILGINAYHAGASACLIRDGELIAAAEEERFTRIKYCAGFPSHAIRYCLGEARITARALDHVGISRDPRANLHKKAWFALSRRPSISFVRVVGLSGKSEVDAISVVPEPSAVAMAAAGLCVALNYYRRARRPTGNSKTTAV